MFALSRSVKRKNGISMLYSVPLSLAFTMTGSVFFSRKLLIKNEHNFQTRMQPLDPFRNDSYDESPTTRRSIRIIIISCNATKLRRNVFHYRLKLLWYIHELEEEKKNVCILSVMQYVEIIRICDSEPNLFTFQCDSKQNHSIAQPF